MKSVNPEPIIPRSHKTEIRVRYQETDAQGRVHHANYVNYFEIGRVELLRSSGFTYRQLEESGIMLVVTDLKCQYFSPAEYDDLLTLETNVVKAKGARIVHVYELSRSNDLVVTGETTVACVGQNGKATRLPKWMRFSS